MKVRYIGRKVKKEDNVAGTGMVWFGHGDVQEVPDTAFSKLLSYPDVWERVTDTHLSLEAAGLVTRPTAAVLLDSLGHPLGVSQQSTATPVPTPAPPPADAGTSAGNMNGEGAAHPGTPPLTDTPPPPTVKEAADCKFVLDGPNGAVLLDNMDDVALRAWVAEHLTPAGIKVHAQIKGDKLRQAIVDAVKAATAKPEGQE